MTKQELEAKISETKTLGRYVFNEEKKCFLGDAEIELYIALRGEELYQSVSYYFDGYEIWLEDEDREFYKADKETALKMTIESFNAQPEIFMDYPIYYTNISCFVHEA